MAPEGSIRRSVVCCDAVHGGGGEWKGRDGLAAFDGNDISGEKAGDGRGRDDAVGNCFLLPPPGCRLNG